MTVEVEQNAPTGNNLRDIEKGIEGGLAGEAAVPPAPVSEDTDDTHVNGHTSSSEDEEVAVADEKAAPRPELQRQQSQAENLGKARVVLIILSLCVCPHLPYSIYHSLPLILT